MTQIVNLSTPLKSNFGGLITYQKVSGSYTTSFITDENSSFLRWKVEVNIKSTTQIEVVYVLTGTWTKDPSAQVTATHNLKNFSVKLGLVCF